MKRTFSVITLTLTLSAFAVVSDIQPVEAVTIFYIRSDGMIWPMDANTYIVKSGEFSYKFIRAVYNPIVIQRSHIVLDGDGHKLQDSGGGASWRERTGLYLEEQSNVTIRNITFRDWEYGVLFNSSSHIRIVENYIGGLWGITISKYGIYSCWSANCTISGNLIIHHYYGIKLLESGDTVVSGNKIMTNYDGAKTDSSIAENRFYHNNFINNGIHAEVEYSVDAWDDGCEGNYWDDYTEKYPDALDSDGDGIWDTPYVVNGENVDRYPLVNVYWNPADINHDLKVDMKDVAAAAKAFGSFPGFPNWNCHADITGPTPLEPDGQVDMRDVALAAKHFGDIY